MSNKTKLLFVIPSLGAGGAEKSLVNLLVELDYTKYEVDLFLLSHHGIFQKQVPTEVNILETPALLEAFALSPLKSFAHFFIKGKWSLIYHKLMLILNNRLIKDTHLAEQKNWKHFKHFIPPFTKTYDAAIGYLEKTSNYMVADRTNAKKKIGWIHTDYIKMGLIREIDAIYFRRLNTIVGVSEECVVGLLSVFPNFSDKFVIVENITSSKQILKLAEEQTPPSFQKPYIASVGRLCEPKNFSLAIKTCKLLKSKGVHLQWLVIGEGELRMQLEQQIKEAGLGNDFILLGLKVNPYPYIKNAFIYCQPSLFEGKSIAIDEAKLLCKPIVVTNFSTVYDQISDGQTGLIAEMTPESLAEKLEQLFADEDLRKQLIANLEADKTKAIAKEKEIVKQFEDLIHA